MLDNHVYDLMAQMVEEHQSLYRIKTMYRKDAEGCETCYSFWSKMETEKEAHIKELYQLIEDHLFKSKKSFYYGKGEKKAEEAGD